jgi:hypothetical protein
MGQATHSQGEQMNLTEKEKQLFVGIAHKIERAGGHEARVKFLQSHGEDMPAIKLSSQEMALMKGGKQWFVNTDGNLVEKSAAGKFLYNLFSKDDLVTIPEYQKTRGLSF